MSTLEPSAFSEPSIRDLLGFFWRGRWYALLGAFLGIALAAGYLWRTPRTYEVEVIVSPAGQGDMGGQLNGLLGQLGGVGSILGLNLPMQGSSQEALATLRSRTFAAAFIEAEELIPALFPERWDSRAGDWRVEPSGVPTLDDALRRFDKKVRFVEEDRRTGLVSIRVRLQDRTRLAQLANRYVEMANESIRARTIIDAESALEFLRKEAASSREVEVQQSIFRVMESQLTIVALARTRPDFAFRVIDPATEPSPRRHVSPRVPQVLAVGLASGLLMGSILGLLWTARSRSHRHSAT